MIYMKDFNLGTITPFRLWNMQSWYYLISV